LNFFPFFLKKKQMFGREKISESMLIK